MFRFVDNDSAGHHWGRKTTTTIFNFFIIKVKNFNQLKVIFGGGNRLKMKVYAVNFSSEI